MTKSGGKTTGVGGARQLKVRVKTAKKRSISSARWLTRQLNDPYVTAAKKQGFRSRAAFKLQELDEKFHLLRHGARVVDLGAAPGGWSQIAGQKGAKVFAVDILPMDPLPGVEVVCADFLDETKRAEFLALIGGPVDVVLSDMAAPTTGHRATDHLRTMALAEEAFNFAEDVLKPGGAFVAKLFQGGAEAGLLDRIKARFAVVKHVKPKSSRAESVENYLVATGFRSAVATEPKQE